MFAEKFGGNPEWYANQLREMIDSSEIQVVKGEATSAGRMPKPLPAYSGSPFSTHRSTGCANFRSLEILLPNKIPASELLRYTVDDGDPLKVLKLKDGQIRDVNTRTLNTYRHSLNGLIEIVRHLVGGELKKELFHDDGRCNADAFQKLAADLYLQTPGRMDEKIRDAQQWNVPREK